MNARFRPQGTALGFWKFHTILPTALRFSARALFRIISVTGAQKVRSWHRERPRPNIEPYFNSSE